jgi:hypothetical protein
VKEGASLRLQGIGKNLIIDGKDDKNSLGISATETARTVSKRKALRSTHRVLV